jgi:hypothetical protein
MELNVVALMVGGICFWQKEKKPTNNEWREMMLFLGLTQDSEVGGIISDG